MPWTMERHVPNIVISYIDDKYIPCRLSQGINIRENFQWEFMYVFICTGEFGVVYKGWYTNDSETVEVAIKKTKGYVSYVAIYVL